jgi:hypothetical protein
LWLPAQRFLSVIFSTSFDQNVRTI